jgi:DNA helicase-2/ATP-dependent DNA helicase PcrA
MKDFETKYKAKYQTEYQKLNNEQKEAVDSIFGPVLVVAGPGSGKTQLLALRVANILDKTDTLPNQILCLTFTDSAANNMKTRLASFMGPMAYKVAVHTFHSFATEVIAQNQEYFFFGAGFRPVDPITQIQILRTIFENLEHKNPLRAHHPEQDYTFLSDALSVIEALKKGGLTPSEFRNLLIQNQFFLEKSDPELSEIFSEKVSVKTVENLWKWFENITNFENTNYLKRLDNSQDAEAHTWTDIYPSLENFVLVQLQQALQQTAENTVKISTSSVTAWKNKFFAKNTQNQSHFKDLLKLGKWLTLADIYENYQDTLFNNGLFDFSDMLLELVKVFEDPNKIDLKYNLQEKFQFILVDEFQDTNGVQMRILENLIDSEINEGLPNVLLVGDDDQAIFKFQGANLANMLKFRSKYPKTKLVRLRKNYRSTQDILDLAMGVIEQSSERLDLEGQKKVIEAVKKL